MEELQETQKTTEGISGNKTNKKNPKHTIRRFIGGGDRETAAVIGEEIQVLVPAIIIFRDTAATRHIMTTAVVLGSYRNIPPPR